MEPVLKRLALLVGVMLLAASMIFSFEGFNFNFSATGALKWVFWIIGITLTASVTIIQLIFNTDYRNLNLTLKIFGVLSYVYSIYTNYIGLDQFVSMDGSGATTIIIAVFLDAVPEPLIAWALGDSLRGDLMGNIMKWVFGWSGKPVSDYQGQSYRDNKHKHDGKREFHFDKAKDLKNTPYWERLPKNRKFEDN